MNMNELAKKVSELEGGKQNLSIAQIKEVIGCLGEVMFLEEIHGPSSLFNRLKLLGAKRLRDRQAKPRKKKLH